MHRDLKSSNVLITRDTGGDFAYKVTDMAMSATIEERRKVIVALSEQAAPQPGAASAAANTGGDGLREALMWTAPEVLEPRSGHNRYYPAADVYSFGIILWEIRSRELP